MLTKENMKTQRHIPTNDKFILKDNVSAKNKSRKLNNDRERNNVYERPIQNSANKENKSFKMEYRIW